MNNEWYIFNDNRVGIIEFPKIFKNNKNVYNLFYQKVYE